MSIHGYPDWQGTPVWRGPALLNISGVNPPQGSMAPPLGVALTNFAYLLLTGSVTGNNVTLVVTFSDSQIVAAPVVQEFDCNQNPFTFIVPVLFDQVAFSYFRPTAAAASLALYVAPVNSPYYLPPAENSVLLFAPTAALAQNASQELSVPPYQGFAQLEVESTQNLYNTRVKDYDIDGSTLLARSYFHHETTNAHSDQIWLPPHVNTIAVTNLAAAAATITVSVLAQSAVPK